MKRCRVDPGGRNTSGTSKQPNNLAVDLERDEASTHARMT